MMKSRLVDRFLMQSMAQGNNRDPVYWDRESLSITKRALTKMDKSDKKELLTDNIPSGWQYLPRMENCNLLLEAAGPRNRRRDQEHYGKAGSQPNAVQMRFVLRFLVKLEPFDIDLVEDWIDSEALGSINKNRQAKLSRSGTEALPRQRTVQIKS